MKNAAMATQKPKRNPGAPLALRMTQTEAVKTTLYVYCVEKLSGRHARGHAAFPAGPGRNSSMAPSELSSIRGRE